MIFEENDCAGAFCGKVKHIGIPNLVLFENVQPGGQNIVGLTNMVKFQNNKYPYVKRVACEVDKKWNIYTFHTLLATQLINFLQEDPKWDLSEVDSSFEQMINSGKITQDDLDLFCSSQY